MSLNSILGGGSSATQPGISFSGITSGLDTTSIIQKLLSLDQQPITDLQNQETALNTRMGLMQSMGALLSQFSTAAKAFNATGAFNPILANSSDATVATITASNTSTAGNYSLSVSALAQAQKISSTAQADTTTALNLSGSFTVNGKGVTVSSTDSLQAIAQKINGTGSGVTASLIDGGSGNAYLTLTSTKTGASNKVQIADFQGSVAGSLGLVTGAAAIRKPITGGAASWDFSSATTPISTMLGMTNVGSQTFNLNGTDVAVNFDTASLQDVANAINSSGSGATASIKAVTVDGTTSQELDITGLTTFADPNGALGALGILQRGYGSELVKAQDASYTLDTVHLTSSSNTITTAIPGATLTLLKADLTTPPTTNLSLSQDTSGIQKMVQNFVDAFNGVTGFIKQNSQLDTTSFQAGPLFGDSAAESVQSQMNNMIMTQIPGLSGPYTNLTQLGFSFDQTGNLSLDATKLTAALQSNPKAVSNLFQTIGSGSNPTVNYISSTSKSVPTGTGAYGITVTALAQQASNGAQTAQTNALSSTETLTFNGAMFNNSPYTVILNSGSTQADVVNTINSDSKLKDYMIASVDSNGKLLLTSKKYGTAANFTVQSSLAAGPDTSGIGNGAIAIQAGTDIAGTINGEPATGAGQFLTGNTGNATTEGLQVQYTGTTTGQVGSVSFTQGISDLMNNLSNSFTDPVSGMLTGVNNSITAEITSMDQEIASLTAAMNAKQATLTQQFADMETAISKLKSQQVSFSSVIGG